MSYLFPKGPNARYKIYKVSVSTPEDKVLQNTSDFNYEVELPYAITDVVGMSLVEWSFPRDVIPSFYPTTTNLVGNIYLDFRLENPDIAGVPGDFTAYYPTKYLAYQLPGDPSSDYTKVTEKIMNEAIAADPLWKDRVNIAFAPQAGNTTVLICSTTDITLPPRRFPETAAWSKNLILRPVMLDNDSPAASRFGYSFGLGISFPLLYSTQFLIFFASFFNSGPNP